MHNIPEVSITWFAIYHLYYKPKLGMKKSVYNSRLLYNNAVVSNLTHSSVCTTSCPYFEYGLGSLRNFSMASFFVCNSGAYTTKPNLVTKKRETPRTFLYLLTLSNLYFSYST